MSFAAGATGPPSVRAPSGEREGRDGLHHGHDGKERPSSPFVPVVKPVASFAFPREDEARLQLPRNMSSMRCW